MDEVTARAAELQEVLKSLHEDIAAIDSPTWESITRIFKLRREYMISTIIQSDNDNDAQANRLKGRAQETEYYLGFMDRVKTGAASTETELRDLQQFVREQSQTQGEDY